MLIQESFIETDLATKFAEFKIRVYDLGIGKEAFVLCSKNLDLTSPPIVRVHSECITGDMLGSLHCDCGRQLERSLQIIAKEGGLLIYLRQEGRGIGLFEKMKSYKLQAQGYDTFEANVILGHQPDLRSYEMVKTILTDLNIGKIRLLTNNPAKLSDIAKLGIEIIERIPLISKANKHNKKYLKTKKEKFKHMSINQSQHYFYQFNIDFSSELELIIEFVKKRKKDPSLKIGVGITANHKSLSDQNEITRINAIINLCKDHPEIRLSIHFSFLQSSDALGDVLELNRIWPTVTQLQINDIPDLKIEFLNKISKIFKLDIPLSDETFTFIHSAQFRRFIKKNQSFLVLDNSKGKGIKERKESFINKIDTLLSYGINDIVLCGGFGPDELDVYFELRRYYRINFSIDAESGLKTHGRCDVEKIKLYLSQLIQFNDPKKEGIKQTRKFLINHRRTAWEKTKINGFEFSIHPKVFHPGHFASSSWFASELSNLLEKDSTFCEVGCGSGVISCLVGLANPLLQITATDINPYAKENTMLNAENLGLSPRFKALTGDVLDNISPYICFDSIFWALPFGFLDPGVNITLEETQVFDPGYRAIRKFLQTAKNYLNPKGRLFIGFSSDLGHPFLLEELAKEFSMELVRIRETVIQEEVRIKFEIIEAKIIPKIKY